MHTCQFVRANSKNKIPFIMLPDATGACSQLRHLGKKLNRNVLYIDDARLSKKDLRVDVNLEALAATYANTIENALQKAGYTLPIPFVLVGYSGGGILANLIQKKLNEKYPGHAISIYIDSVTPEVIQKMTSNEFANHLFKVIGNIGEKYGKASVDLLKLSQEKASVDSSKPSLEKASVDLSKPLPSKEFAQKVPLEQIEAVKKYIKYTDVEDPGQLSDLNRMIKVMLANHKCYLEYQGQLTTVKRGLIFIADDTRRQFGNHLTNGHKNTLGYDLSDVAKQLVNIECAGIDHSTVLLKDESCKFIRDRLVGKGAAFSSDDRITRTMNHAKLEQTVEELLDELSSDSDDEDDPQEEGQRGEEKLQQLRIIMILKHLGVVKVSEKKLNKFPLAMRQSVFKSIQRDLQTLGQQLREECTSSKRKRSNSEEKAVNELKVVLTTDNLASFSIYGLFSKSTNPNSSTASKHDDPSRGTSTNTALPQQ